MSDQIKAEDFDWVRSGMLARGYSDRGELKTIWYKLNPFLGTTVYLVSANGGHEPSEFRSFRDAVDHFNSI